MKLKNKIIVITGAAGGFGQEMTQLFCERGAHVEALDINRESLKKLKTKMEDLGYAIHTHVVDITQARQIETFGQKLSQQKRLPDVWVNNAGISYPQAFEKTPHETFQKIMDVNLNGVIYGTRVALSLMQEKQSGTIVNIASASGHIPSPFLVSYSTSKHAVVGFTRSLQLELSQQASPIKLCLVSPGFADTAIMKSNAEFKTPRYLNWMVSSPQTVAKDIVQAVISGEEEIFPCLTTKGLMSFYKFMPKPIYKAAVRAFTARNWREFLGLEGIRSR